MEEYLQRFKCFDDPEFKFDPIPHKYTYHGKEYISATTLIGRFKEQFKTDYWSKKKAEDRGIDQSEILKEWKEKNDYANDIGTQTHDFIENYFNKIYQPLPTNLDVIDRINKFNKIFAKSLYKLTPIKFELKIFSKKYPIAGMIDSIFLWKGKLIIMDWKTNKIFTNDEHPKGKYQKLLYPFQDFYQNSLNDYSIQVSLYSLILEEWGFDIKASYLVHFGPDEEAKIHKAIDMREELKIFLEDYKMSQPS